MSGQRLGAAVIGLGFGRGHAQAYAAHPQVELRAICDNDPERLERVCRELSVPFATTDYRAILARPDIDLVSVATPDYLHAEMSIAALRAGKHVLCEKPMTTSVAEALAMAAAAREAQRQLMVGQICRFAPGFVAAKRIVDSGEIGRLFFIESEYAHNYGHAAGHRNWRKDPTRPRNAFLGGACHAVDLIRWVGGKIVETFAYANNLAMPDWPVDDCYIAVFKFAPAPGSNQGAIGKVFCSIGCVRPYTMRSVFYGTEGTVICDNRSPSIQVCSRRRIQGEKFEFTEVPVDISAHNIAAEVAEFVDCIINQRPVPTDALEGARTVAACLAASESAATGRPVQIADCELR